MNTVNPGSHPAQKRRGALRRSTTLKVHTESILALKRSNLDSFQNKTPPAAT